MKLQQASAIAERVKGTLAAWCRQIEVAGSVRRQRPECGDIDLVILPHSETAKAEIKRRCLVSSRLVRDGDQNFIVQLHGWPSLPAGCQLDVFFAQPASTDLFTPAPTNLGSLLLCRTGSKEHNIFLIEHAKTLEKKWDPYRGVLAGGRWHHYPQLPSEYLGGELVAAATEMEIFAALGLPFIPPEQRER